MRAMHLESLGKSVKHDSLIFSLEGASLLSHVPHSFPFPGKKLMAPTEEKVVYPLSRHVLYYFRIK
jgi:hypothetical protein